MARPQLAMVLAILAALSPAYLAALWAPNARPISLLLVAAIVAVLARLAGRAGVRRQPAGPGPLAYGVTAAAVIAAGFLLRSASLGSVPPGMTVDEAVYGLEGLDLWTGARSLPPPGNVYPPQPLWRATEALATGLMGPAIAAVRVPAVLAGTGAVAIALVLGRSLWGAWGGLGSGIFACTSFWLVMTGRVGVSASLIPLEGLLIGWLLLSPRFGSRFLPFAAAGALAGLSGYDYMGAWHLPLWGAAAVILRVIRPPLDRRTASLQASAFCAGLVLSLIPLLASLGPATARAREVGLVSRALLPGKAALVAANLFAPVEAAWGTWFNFPAGAARLSPIEAAVALAGMGILLGKRGIPPHLRWTLILWLPFGLLPEIAAQGGINLNRGVGVIAPLALLAGLAASALGSRRAAAALLVTLLLGGSNAALTADRLFRRLPRDPAARSWYLRIGVEAAGKLKSLAGREPLYVYPLPDYRANPILAFLLHREIRDGRLKGGEPGPSLFPIRLVLADPLNEIPCFFLGGGDGSGASRPLLLMNINDVLLDGRTAADGGRLDEAERHFRRVLREVPGLGLARAELALVLLAKGDRKGALVELERAGDFGIMAADRMRYAPLDSLRR